MALGTVLAETTAANVEPVIAVLAIALLLQREILRTVGGREWARRTRTVDWLVWPLVAFFLVVVSVRLGRLL